MINMTIPGLSAFDTIQWTLVNEASLALLGLLPKRNQHTDEKDYLYNLYKLIQVSFMQLVNTQSS